MKKIRKSTVLFIILALLVSGIPMSASAQSVQVTVPSFKVTINGVVMENQYNQYPLIVYKNITYFPMAYNYASFMGLKSNWYPDSRLGPVLFVGVSEQRASELVYYKTNTANKKSYTATIPTYKIALNTTL